MQYDEIGPWVPMDELAPRNGIIYWRGEWVSDENWIGERRSIPVRPTHYLPSGF